jgi:hypothetical protein
MRSTLSSRALTERVSAAAARVGIMKRRMESARASKPWRVRVAKVTPLRVPFVKQSGTQT